MASIIQSYNYSIDIYYVLENKESDILVESIQKDNTEIVKITKELKDICLKQEINIEKLAIAVDSLSNNDKEFMDFMKQYNSKGNGYVEKVAFILIGAIPSWLMNWILKK